MGLCVAEDTCLRDKKAEWDGTSKEREENSALRATPTGWTKTFPRVRHIACRSF